MKTEVARNDRLMVPLIGVLAPLATVALVVGPIIMAWNELPDPMATGWGGGGAVRSSASPGTFLAIQSSLAATCAVLFALGGFRRFAMPIINGTVAVIAASIAPTLAIVSISVVVANRGLADWTGAADPGWGWLIGAIVTPLPAIAAVGWVMRSTFLTRPETVTDPPSAGLTIGETGSAAWHSQATAPWPRMIGIPLLVFGVVTAVVGPFLVGMGALVTGLSAVLIGLSCLAFSSVLVSVDRRGLTVRYGPLPWPRSHVALAAVKTASPIHVRPTEHGGWGYRGSRKLLGKAAVVVRGGDGIRVDLVDGTEFVVTVDDADRGAGVLNDLRATMAG